MKQEQVLVALYDIALTLAGEVQVQALTRNFLERLLFHTGFACGAILIQEEGGARLAQAMGNRDLMRRVGQIVDWPDLVGDNTLLNAAALPEDLFQGASRYRGLLCLRRNGVKVLLFAPALPKAQVDYAVVFEPVLARFVAAYAVCVEAEAHARDLERQVEERKQAERALKEGQRQLWQTLEFLPLPILAFGQDGRIQYVNARFSECLGYDLEDLPDVETWWLRAYPDAERRAEARAKWNEVVVTARLERTDIPPFTSRLIAKQGEAREMEVRAASVGGRTLVSLIDLASRKEGGLDAARFLDELMGDLSGYLNAILGYTQLLEMEPGLAPGALGLVQEVEQAGRGLQGELERAQARLVQASATPVPTPAVRILVAEDYAPNRQLIRRQLERLGYEAEFAENGAEALALWQAKGHDLILTDCNMPVLDGKGLAREIRAVESSRGGHVPIVAITANTVQVDVEACLAAGIDDYLPKPVQIPELDRVLSRWLRPRGALQAPAPVVPPVSVPPVSVSAPEAGGADSPELRLDTLAGLMGEDDPEQLRHLLDIFSTSVQELLQEATRAREMGSASEIAQAMHKLKSSALTIGASHLAVQAQALELAAKASDLDQVDVHLPGLGRDIEAVVAEISGLLAKAGEAVIQTSQPTLADSELADVGVLVVDDDPFIREQLAGMLRRMGVGRLYRAGNGHEALAVLEHEAAGVDVIVSDLNMPGMDGVEFIRHLCARKYPGAVAFVSGEDSRVLSTVQELAAAQGLRVLGALSKPVASAALYDALGRRQGGGQRRAQASQGPQVTVADVEKGIAEGEFTVFFQPKVDATSLKILGVEALARWQHPQWGMVSPGVFIPLAEANGLIEPLTVALLGRAMELGSDLHRAGYPIKISVNYSAQSFGSLGLPEFIVAKAAQVGLEPKDLIIEVTETGLMQDLTVALDVLSRLRLKGVNLSIDDFGTGYSSMDQLRRIPFGELKIDQGFVRGAATDKLARSILEASVEMAKRLKLTTVAEGVETEEELALMRAMGCDMIQGYYIAKPMALPDLLAWLRR